MSSRSAATESDTLASRPAPSAGAGMVLLQKAAPGVDRPMGVERLAVACSAILATACAEIASIDEWPGATAGAAGAGGQVSTGYALEVLADEPKSYWRLGEQPGDDIAKDISGPNDGRYIAVSLGVLGAVEGDKPSDAPNQGNPSGPGRCTPHRCRLPKDPNPSSPLRRSRCRPAHPP